MYQLDRQFYRKFIWVLAALLLWPGMPLAGTASVVQAASAEWTSIGSPNFSTSQAYYTNIALDSSNRPYIVFYDLAQAGKTTVMKWNGLTWEVVGSAGFSAGSVSATGIALDSSDTPYVMYKDLGNGRTTVMKYDGVNWIGVGAAGFSAGIVSDPSLVLDSHDTPYVVYQDEGNGNKATVMKYDGASWTEVGAAGFTEGTASDVSIAMASDDTPYVVYQDGDNGNKATMMKYDGASWTEVGAAGFTAGTASEMNVAMASDDTPYVVYTDGGNGNKATVMKYDGDWTEVGTAGFSQGSVHFADIALDSGDTPYVVYIDDFNSGKATVMTYDGSVWGIAGQAGFSANQAYFTTIAIDANDTPYVAYSDLSANVMSLHTAYTVTYDENGSTGGTVPNDSSLYAEGTSVVVADNTGSLVRTGHMFEQWNTQADGNGTDYAPGDAMLIGSADITLYAKWVANQYTVSFESNGGTAVSSQSVDYGEYAVEPASPRKAGYSFAGWYADVGLTIPYSFADAIQEDAVLHAKWNSSGFTNPSNLTADPGDRQVTLQWDTVTGATYYHIYRGMASGNYSGIPAITVTDATYQLTGLVNGFTYYFAVTAEGAAGESGYSNEVAASPQAAVAPARKKWRHIGDPSFSTSQAYYTDLALDSHNTPYIVFYDLDHTGKATVMKYNGTAWEIVGAAGFSAGTVADTSIALDSSDTPYVVYQDGGSGGKATVMKYDGANWTEVGAAGFSTGSATDTSLAIASDDTLYVAYADGGSSGKATVMKYDGANWTEVGAAGFSTGSVSDMSFAIASDDTLYVAYADGGNSGKATVMKYDGVNWIEVGAAGFSTGSVSDTSLAVDHVGALYVVYQDGSNGNKATVMKYNGTAWESVGAKGFSAGAVSDTDIAITSDHTLYVVYGDAVNAGKATVMTYDGTSWNVAGAVGLSADASYYTSIVLDSRDTPYVVYSALSANVQVLKPVYTIDYDGNGSTGGVAPTDSSFYWAGEPATVAANSGNLARTGYTFESWNTQADGNGTDYAAGAVFIMGEADVTLYAKWSANQYTVSFESNGGTEVFAQTVRYNEEATEPSAPEKAGHTFGGWYEDEGLTSAYDFADAITADLTLYAKWQRDNNNRPSRNSDDDSYSETIPVRVESGSEDGSVKIVTTLTISRTTDADGQHRDETTFTPEAAARTVEQLEAAGSASAKFVVSDEQDEIAVFQMNIPQASAEHLAASHISLEIATAHAHIHVPSASLQEVQEDIYFRIVPIRQENERKEAEQRAVTDPIVRLAVGSHNGDIQIASKPITIETNIQNREMELVLPLHDDSLRDDQLRNLGVFIEHSDGTKQFIKGEIVAYDDTGRQGIRFSVDRFSTFIVLHADGLHQDLSPDPTADNLHAPYITGYPDGTFGPDKQLTRAEMAVIFSRIFEHEQPLEAAAAGDGTVRHWAEDAIAQVLAAGLMSGYADGSFRPDQAITRAEMASIAARLTDPLPQVNGSFTDINGHWAREAIDKVKSAGVISGYEDGSFRPDEAVTRAEAVIMINRLTGRSPLSGAKPQWKDVLQEHWAYEHIQAASIQQE